MLQRKLIRVQDLSRVMVKRLAGSGLEAIADTRKLQKSLGDLGLAINSPLKHLGLFEHKGLDLVISSQSGSQIR